MDNNIKPSKYTGTHIFPSAENIIISFFPTPDYVPYPQPTGRFIFTIVTKSIINEDQI